MDNLYFRSYGNAPFYQAHNGRVARGIPVEGVRTATTPRMVAAQPFQTTRPAESPKVVTVPVHFVGSEKRRSELDSALRIQKVFRGFVVRKSLKKITAVRREVAEIEKRISANETVGLIRRDSRERLKVGEILMSLLLRLDSVRGLDSGVRDCRKAVIKKVIALQEALDAIVFGGDTLAVERADAEAETAVEEAAQIIEAEKQPGHKYKLSDPCSQAQIEYSGPRAAVDGPVSAELATGKAEIPQINSKPCPEPPEKSPDTPRENERNDAEGEGSDIAERTESQTDSSDNPESPVEGNEEKNGEQSKEENETKKSAGDGKQKNKEMLEKMMEDNERMMEMMMELFDRNEMQTRLLTSLSRRVEQLEKAFVCDKLRRKRKKQAVPKAGIPEKPTDDQKSGKR